MVLFKADGSALRVGFVGAGMMGGAMIKGLVDSGTVAAGNIVATDLSAERLAKLSSEVPGLLTSSMNGAVGGCDVIVLAVEPKDIELVCEEIGVEHAKSCRAVFVSLAAGTTLGHLGKWLSWLSAAPRVVRVMPNTPCTVGEMAAGYTTNEACTPADTALVGALLGSLGSALKVCAHDASSDPS